VTRTRLATEADFAAVVRGGRRAEAPKVLVATFETEPRRADDIARLMKERAARWPTVVVERGRAVIAWAGAGVAEFYLDSAHRGVREVGTYRRHAKLDGEWLDTVIIERLIGEAVR
jgi:L-amino acid N-acyltransferase YncA